MNINFELGREKDIDELERLYNDLNDYLSEGVNYPGWKKGIYPVRQDAIDGIKEEGLYVARYNGKIVGSMLNRYVAFIKELVTSGNLGLSSSRFFKEIEFKDFQNEKSEFMKQHLAEAIISTSAFDDLKENEEFKKIIEELRSL